MKTLKTYLLAAFIVASWSISAFAITFGEVDEENHFSNVGAIVGLPKPDSGGAPGIMCSGILIHPRVMLTAAHCTYRIETLLEQGVPMRAFRVSFSPYAFDESTWLEIDKVVTHPQYVNFQGPEGYANPHDVGVIILQKPVKKVQPARLPEPGLLDFLFDAGQLRDGPEHGAELTVAGYGSMLDFPPPEYLRPDGLRRSAVSQFQAITDTWVILSQNPALDNGGAGFGDSGGPTFWLDPLTGEQVVIAVTSWGDANSLSIDFHYRTDIPETLDFVDCVIAAVEARLL